SQHTTTGTNPPTAGERYCFTHPSDITNSTSVAELTTGRELVVSTISQAPKPSRMTFQVSVRDGAAETSVDRQGHGFQRALIIAALKLLAKRKSPNSGAKTLCLAIEEPELFQHPPQARTFAEVLRKLVTASTGGRTQVMYATHSPVFIDPRNYHQIRRLSRDGGTGHPVTRVCQVSEGDLREALAGIVKENTIKRNAGTWCSSALAEGFFGHAAILVEGPTDEGVLLGCAERLGINLGAQGITIVVAGSKSNIPLSHAILTALGVPCYVVFDGDAGMLEEKTQSVDHLPPDKRAEKVADFQNQARSNAIKNRELLRYLGGASASDPPTTVDVTYAVFSDRLETYLANEWPSWGERRRELINAGDGFEQKDAATYREAALTADSAPPFHLAGILESAQLMIR
ncbi:ATP-dependent nuclease, partial [Kitasatospora sp. NPDC088160]|uniref:ATP-dependent nuclease n=1 Tax=Kitasatospora sp. NPDC088160 TaxID=3364072 RepID=UPI00381B880F